MSAEGLPAIHHSEQYSGLYAPAYRVVSCELLGVMLPLQGPQAAGYTTSVRNDGARDWNRTSTPVRALPPQDSASTYSATRACE